MFRLISVRPDIEKGNNDTIFDQGARERYREERSLRNIRHASAYVTRVAEGKGPNYLLGRNAICFDTCVCSSHVDRRTMLRLHELDESFIYLLVVDAFTRACRRSHTKRAHDAHYVSTRIKNVPPFRD